MKISYNWLSELIELKESPEELGDILTDIGLEVEGITPYEALPGSLGDFVIGKVLTCTKHPNADKLSKTTVEIGDSEPVQIICGAPNVRAGQTVVVAKVGALIQIEGREPFEIKKAKIRGEYSNGMICAEDELGMGSAHEGIVVLENDLKPGLPAGEYFEIPKKDFVFEIGLTPNRGDAASHLGVARDLRAYLNRRVHQHQIDDIASVHDAETKEIEVIVDDVEGCPRYTGVTLTAVRVDDSPFWLKSRLKSIGLTPINNVVDITNFVLHETGQPLHAFDYDQISGQKIIVKTLDKGAVFTTLDEKERKLRSDDLMICNQEEGMCIAGVFGGIKSGVKETTTRVFLESAYFSPEYIRKTAQFHALKTDASFRFERGTDPRGTVYAIKRAAQLMTELTGAKVVGGITDSYPVDIQDSEVDVKYHHIRRLIGQEIEKDRIKDILGLLDITITKESDEGFHALVPPYRVDVKREADIIEEILRIFGFNKIELPDQLSSEFLANHQENAPGQWRSKISTLLAGNGWSEILTNSLTSSAYLQLDKALESGENVQVVNKLSEDLDVLRQSMLFTGMEVVAFNINRKRSDLRLFEFGKTYKKTDASSYRESEKLALFLTGEYGLKDWRNLSHPADFYDLSAQVHGIFSSILPGEITSEPTDILVFDFGSKFFLNSKEIGIAGRLRKSVTDHFGLKQEIFYAEIEWDLLLKYAGRNIVFSEVPKFPAVKRDLSLVVDKGLSFKDIQQVAFQTEPRLLTGINVFDVYEGKRIDPGKKAYAMTLTLQDQNKTLTDKVIEKTMGKLIKAFESKTGAYIRQ